MALGEIHSHRKPKQILTTVTCSKACKVKIKCISKPSLEIWTANAALIITTKPMAVACHPAAVMVGTCKVKYTHY